jgi:cobalt-zinc-cadmium efflux system membrane fusion protein
MITKTYSPSSMQRLAVATLALALGLLLTACGPADPAEKKPKAPQLPPGEVILKADSPKRAYIKESLLQLSPRPLMEPVAGKVVYDETRTARISSPIAGRVVSSLAPLGTKVKEGSALIELDSPDLGTARAEYAKALADLRLAEKAYERSKTLYEGRVIARKDLEQAKSDLARTQSEVQRTRQHLLNLRINGNDNGPYNRFVLRAPIAGILTERNVNPGMEVRPDLQAPLYVVSDLSGLWVLIDVFEKDLGLIRVGQQVQVRVPAYPGQSFPATVEYIGQMVDESTRTVKVRCVIQNPDGKLLPAMYATVDVQSRPEDQAIVVPLTALFTEGESDRVFVALDVGHYRKREVKVGLHLKDRAVIESGLQAGETLVTEGALMLRTEEAPEEESEV